MLLLEREYRKRKVEIVRRNLYPHNQNHLKGMMLAFKLCSQFLQSKGAPSI